MLPAAATSFVHLISFGVRLFLFSTIWYTLARCLLPNVFVRANAWCKPFWSFSHSIRAIAAAIFGLVSTEELTNIFHTRKWAHQFDEKFSFFSSFLLLFQQQHHPNAFVFWANTFGRCKDNMQNKQRKKANINSYEKRAFEIKWEHNVEDEKGRKKKIWKCFVSFDWRKQRLETEPKTLRSSRWEIVVWNCWSENG